MCHRRLLAGPMAVLMSSVPMAALMAVLIVGPVGKALAQDNPAQTYPTARPLVSSGVTVTNEAIRYPQGAARVSGSIITVAPGRETGWHRHGVPLFAYILAGELTVDYGAKGSRTYKAGDGFLEAMATAHNGRNGGGEPVSILVVTIGADGAPEVLPAK